MDLTRGLKKSVSYFFGFGQSKVKELRYLIREFSPSEDMCSRLSFLKKIDYVEIFYKNLTNLGDAYFIYALIKGENPYENTGGIIFLESLRFFVNYSYVKTLGKGISKFKEKIKPTLSHQTLEEMAESYESRRDDELSDGWDEDEDFD
jgi:hypothetical protein